MRVILQVTSGPSAGRKALLGASQVLQVGRTEWADFTLAHDGRMSGVHFALETDNASCSIRDLGSTNGTWVNGQPLAERKLLKSGDEVRAGETLFTVRVEGEVPGEAAGAAAPGPAVERPLVPGPSAAAGPAVPGSAEAPAARRRGKTAVAAASQ